MQSEAKHDIHESWESIHGSWYEEVLSSLCSQSRASLHVKVKSWWMRLLGKEWLCRDSHKFPDGTQLYSNWKQQVHLTKLMGEFDSSA